MPILTSDIK